MRWPASHREIASARRARSRHAPRDRRSDGGAAARPAIRGAHGRAWSSDASSRRSRRDETGSRTHGRAGTPAPGSRRPPPAIRRPREVQILRGASGRHDPASAGRSSARPAWGGSGNIRSARGLPDAARPGAPSCLASICAPRQIPRNGRCSRERHGDPVDLPANIVIRIVGAHRAAENDRAGMVVQRFRQRIAKARTPDIQADARAPATHCRRGPASRFPGAGRSEPAATVWRLRRDGAFASREVQHGFGVDFER